MSRSQLLFLKDRNIYPLIRRLRNLYAKMDLNGTCLYYTIFNCPWFLKVFIFTECKYIYIYIFMKHLRKYNSSSSLPKEMQKYQLRFIYWVISNWNLVKRIALSLSYRYLIISVSLYLTQTLIAYNLTCK